METTASEKGGETKLKARSQGSYVEHFTKEFKINFTVFFSGGEVVCASECRCLQRSEALGPLELGF